MFDPTLGRGEGGGSSRERFGEVPEEEPVFIEGEPAPNVEELFMQDRGRTEPSDLLTVTGIKRMGPDFGLSDIMRGDRGRGKGVLPSLLTFGSLAFVIGNVLLQAIGYHSTFLAWSLLFGLGGIAVGFVLLVIAVWMYGRD